jgi:ELWxxDGT repeat protein
VHLIKDIDQSNSIFGSNPHNFTQFGDYVYFVGGDAGSRLWITSGDAASTHELSPNLSVGAIALSGGRLFIHANDAFGDSGLWAIDSAGGQPRLVKNLVSEFSTAYLGNFFDLNGRLLFFASDNVHGVEPWSSDGTAATTQRLADTVQGLGSGELLHSMVEYHGRAYFTHFNMVENGPFEMALWSTDGTPAGTHPVFTSPSYLGAAFSLNNKICFVVNDSSEIWCSDGTSVGTTRAVELGAALVDVVYDRFVATSARAYFKAYTVELGEELWVTDGTQAGTRPISNIPGAFRDMVDEIVNVDGKIYFTATADGFETRLWLVDEGAQSVTALTSAATSNEELLWPRLLTNFNGTLAFLGKRVSGEEEIWMSNGTPIGTQRIARFDFHSVWDMRGFTVAGQSLFFDGDGGEGREPWMWSNRRPQAVSDQFEVKGNDWTTLDVLANDSDTDGVLARDSIEIVDQPKFGETQLIDGRIRYKAARATVADYFSYRVRDTQGGVSEVTRVSVGSGSGSGTGAIDCTWFCLLAFACVSRWVVRANKRNSQMH